MFREIIEDIDEDDSGLSYIIRNSSSCSGRLLRILTRTVAASLTYIWNSSSCSGRLLRTLTRTVAASWSLVSSVSWRPSSWWRRTRRLSRRSSRRPSGYTTRYRRFRQSYIHNCSVVNRIQNNFPDPGPARMKEQKIKVVFLIFLMWIWSVVL